MTNKLSLRSKLICLIVLLVLCFSLALSFYLKTFFAQSLSNELIKRGASISRYVAQISMGAFIERDYFELHSLAKGFKTAEKDIVYILMLDQHNAVIAHSFGGGYPIDLDKVEHSLNKETPSIKNINFGGSPVYDIAVPVQDGRLGSVRIGISAQGVQQSVDHIMGQIIGTISALGFLTLIITISALQSVIRPVSVLTHAVKQLTRGKWDQTLAVSSNDELGLLTDAFNQMAATIKTTEEQLAAHANFLQVLIDDIPIPVFYQGIQGEMLGCNHAYSNFWGKKKDGILGHYAGEIHSQVDIELQQNKDRELFEKQIPVHYEQRVFAANGQPRIVIFNKALFYNEKEQPAGIIGVMQDVTEQRRADQLKSEFVSTVAHEFQTPLSIILGYSELIKENTLNQHEYREALELITQKAEHLSEMVDELLDLTRLETGKQLKMHQETINAKQLLATLINRFSKRIKNYRFELELPPNDLFIFADPTRIGQVMENLLNNAVKYSKEHSRVKVVVTEDGKYCQVQTIDQGIGMTEDQVQRIFEKYYRADASDTAPAGTGLGLYITKSIIDAHGGDIEVESSPGKGTTVTFRIPSEPHPHSAPQ